MCVDVHHRAHAVDHLLRLTFKSLRIAPIASRSAISRYAVAVAVSLLVAFLRAALAALVPGQAPLQLAHIAVVVAAWWGGRGPGLLATAICAVVGGTLFVPPYGQWPPSVADVARLVVFLMVGGAISIMAGVMHSAVRRASNQREALRESEQRLRLALQGLRIGLWSIDLQSGTESFDRTACELLGLRPDRTEYRAGTLLERVHPQDIGRVRTVLENAIAGVMRIVDYRCLRTDGQIRWTSARVTLQLDDKGHAARLVGISVDITEHKEAEAHVRQQATLMDYAHEALIVRETGGTIRYWNHGAEALYGYSAADAIGTPIHALFGAEERVEELEQALAQQGVWEGELTYTVRSGRRIIVESRQTAVTTDDGRTLILESNRDITERKLAEERLRELQRSTADSLALLDTLQTHAPIGIAYIDRDYRFQRVNDELASINGVPAADHIGRTVREIIPGLWPQLEPIYRRVFDGEPVLNVDISGETAAKPGELRHWAASYYPVRGAEDDVVGLGVVIAEITERKRVEAAVRESEARWRELAEAMPHLVWTCTPDGRCDYLSHQWVDYTGRPEAEQLGYGWLESIHAADRKTLMIAWNEAITSTTLFDVEFRIRGADQQYRWFKTRAVPVRDATGRVTKWYGSNTDIENLKRVEAAMREGEERLQLAIAAGRLGMWEMDVQSEAGIIDARVAELLDFAPGTQHVTVRDVVSRVHADDRGMLLAAVDRVTRGKAPLDVEFRVPDARTGEIRWLAGKGGLIRSRDGSSLRLAGVNFEVTERKRAEAALREQAAALADTARQKDEFLAMLGHELRNPLAPIRTALELLRRVGPQHAMARRAWDVIDRQITHMVRLLEDLLEVSRITSGRINLNIQEIDLRRIVTEAIESTRPLIEARHHYLETVVPDRPLVVRGDGTRLVQVLVNLLNNAAKYTDEGGTIRVVVDDRGGEAILRVIDNGAGISPRLLPKIFDLFTQDDRTLDRAQGGLGLGLTLVRRLTELHGGSVEARSDGRAGGSEFIVRLPMHHGEEVSGLTAVPAPSMRPGRRLRCLVVDDNIDAAHMLETLLTAEGHDVHVAFDGRDAVDAAASYRPDAVVLDIGLPRMNGYDVARAIRRLPGLEQVLMIAATGYGQDSDRQKSREAGFDHHLVKPIELDVLLRTLAQDRSQAEGAHPAEAGTYDVGAAGV
jgi:PAS domain S-box-containing protein